MFIGRGSLPANYEDFARSTTARLLLPQPEPQYVFAHWAMAGRISLAALNAGAPSVQQYITAAGGGAPMPADLDRMARVADTYPGFIQAVEEFGKNQGDTIKFQRPVFSTGGLTEAARELITDADISVTGAAVASEEVPVVLKQYIGPYLASGAGPQPFAIANFDSKYRANKLQLTSIASLHLVRDYTKWLDIVIRDRFRVADFITFATEAITAATGFVAGGGAKFSLDGIMRARKTLSDREWAKFPNGRYVCMVPTCFNTDMIEDIEYRELSRSHADRNQLYGYIGSVQDVDFFECTTLKQYAAGSTVPGTAGGTVPANVTLEEALLIGPGAVGFGTAAPDPEGVMGPVVRFADNTNYGTMAKVIWYALHAFQTLDSRGVQRILTQSA